MRPPLPVPVTSGSARWLRRSNREQTSAHAVTPKSAGRGQRGYVQLVPLVAAHPHHLIASSSRHGLKVIMSDRIRPKIGRTCPKEAGRLP